MDEQRALLDQLMGQDRDLPTERKRKRHFSDPGVCKFFLCGLCPYELFANTKSDLGGHRHGEVDDEEMRREWNKLSQEEKDRYGYEWDLLRFLEDIVAKCDRKVHRNQERVVQEEKDAAPSREEVQALVGLERQMEDLIMSATALAEQRKGEEAMDLMREVAELEKRRQRLLSHPEKRSQTTLVCSVSGNFMSSLDSIDRVRCHFAGKQYQGWRMCREKLGELRQRLGSRNPGRWREEAGHREHGPGYRRGEGRGFGRPHNWDRDRDRGREWERDRDRERDRGRGRGRYDDGYGDGHRGGHGWGGHREPWERGHHGGFTRQRRY